MKKAEIIAALSAKTGMTHKQSDIFLKAFAETVTEALQKGDEVQLVGFGTFGIRKIPARICHNPANGAIVEANETRSPFFKAGKTFKAKFR